MLDGLNLDPYEVLGVSRNAGPDEVREAFHLKSKKHHPDAGGDAWAFRVVTRAYQVLLAREPGPASRPGATARPPGPAAETARLRAGVTDRGLEPYRLVAVEVVWRRYEVGDFLELLSEPTGERNLGGSISLRWPDPERPAAAPPPADQVERILRALNAAFDDLRGRTPATSAGSTIDDGRFEAELSYANGPLAAEAFKRLHVNLRARGLGVRQWTRDITVPRPAGG